jgi:cellulase
MKISTSLALAAAATSTSAHTIFLSVNGGAVGDGVRVPTYDGVNLILLQSPLFSI